MYTARIVAGEPAMSGDVVLYVYIEKDGTVLKGGRMSVELDGQAVLSITESAMTDGEKRQALIVLFTDTVRELGVNSSDDAYEQLFALLPNGWPVTVEL